MYFTFIYHKISYLIHYKKLKYVYIYTCVPGTSSINVPKVKVQYNIMNFKYM